MEAEEIQIAEGALSTHDSSVGAFLAVRLKSISPAHSWNDSMIVSDNRDRRIS
jgi:hypothetical protein